MKILHIIRQPDDSTALELARWQVAQGHWVSILLLHDAVLGKLTFPGPVLACRDDVVARGGACSPSLRGLRRDSEYDF